MADNLFSSTHLKKMVKGVELFNQQKYWECHEELEHHWLDHRGDPARYVFWAVIQVAASMIHYRDSNLQGAKGLLVKAQEKFERCEELNLENHLLTYNLSWSELKREVFAISPADQLDAYGTLYNFRFKDPSLWHYHF